MKVKCTICSEGNSEIGTFKYPIVPRVGDNLYLGGEYITPNSLKVVRVVLSTLQAPRVHVTGQIVKRKKVMQEVYEEQNIQ
jgi:hypothetical protein